MRRLAFYAIGLFLLNSVSTFWLPAASAECVKNPDGRIGETRIQFEDFYLLARNSSSIQLLIKGPLESNNLSKLIKVGDGEVALINAVYNSNKVSSKTKSEKILEIWYTRDIMLIVFAGQHVYPNKSNFYSFVSKNEVECGDLPEDSDLTSIREIFKDYRLVETDTVSFTSQEAILERLGL